MSLATDPTALPPIVKSIEIDRSLEDAFRLFTGETARWWPLASHSVGGEDAQWCGIEPRVGGRVFERTGSGDEHVWGTVTLWEPPHRVAFTWHPGQPAEPHTEVELTFTAAADKRTRVVLEHRGWAALGEGAESIHRNYDPGWDLVFGRHFGEIAGT